MSRNHDFLRDPANRDEWGNIKDGVVCPRCHQPRKGSDFFSKKDNVFVSLCLTCRRKHTLISPSTAGFDTPL